MSIIVLDTETTGTDSEVDRLVELAAVHFDPRVPQFTTLVDPLRAIPPEARAIHHIGPEDVMGQPLESQALRAMLGHFEKFAPGVAYAAAHNAKFDRGFIERINPALNLKWICTYRSAIMAWPDAPGHSNQVLRYYLGLTIDVPSDLFPHRALYDAIVTRAILHKLVELHPLEQLFQWSNYPILLPYVTFGKYKGMRWSAVPYGYLKWCVGQEGMDELVLHTANYYLRRG